MKQNGFNLLPKETFEKREKARVKLDRVSIVSAVFPLIAVLVWIVFILISSFIRRDIAGINQEIRSVEDEIASYKLLQDRKALLVLKTRALTEIVTLDVNPENFFTIVQTAIENSGRDTEIISYGRETTGAFFIAAHADNAASVADITRIFRNTDKLEAIQLTNVSDVEDQDRILFTLVFTILD
ncbi:hypothetical protein KC717_00890 [Candidatus Dojkabacteria bacterium]|uniref:PilN domain-containing protein n=1 Tax=Candidatus Dojkabacteria bacterium TaxID=2099670 RepID=A0A955L7X4_9BACT|nr:hypothetical protein [Candidatus Dojkabacteria bacterium]